MLWPLEIDRGNELGTRNEGSIVLVEGDGDSSTSFR